MSIPAPLLEGRLRQYTLGHLIEGAEVPEPRDGERVLLRHLLPAWQRPEVWTAAQKQNFVEGLFLGMNCGIYVVNGMDWDENGRKPRGGWLLDGQQRLSALRDFFQGDMVVFGDVTFAGLSEPQRLRFLRKPLGCHELDYIADESVLKQVYNRLNFGGTPHAEADRV